MRPTLRCVLVMAMGLPVALAPALVSAEAWPLWLAFAIGMLLAIGLDVLLAVPRRRIDVRPRLPDTIFIGEAGSFEVELTARGGRRSTAIEALADLDDDFETAPVITTRAGGDPVSLVIPLVARRRGELRVERVSLRWTGPFGLMRRQIVVPIEQAIAVVPNIRAVRSAALRFFSSREFIAGLKQEAYVGDGSEFESLREFVPGLDHRAINWKASARHRKLLSQEFRAERNHQIVLALDTGQLMSEPMRGIPKLDHALNSGLLLAYFGLRTGDRVGLYAFDQQVRTYVEPTGGLAAFNRIRRRTAEIDYYHTETNFTLGLAELSLRLRRRSLIVLLTDFVDTTTAELMAESLYRLARKHLVIFVTLRDPSLAARASALPRSLTELHESVIAHEFVNERVVVLRRLRNFGVHCIDVPPAQVSVRLLNRYLDIKRRELI